MKEYSQILIVSHLSAFIGKTFDEANIDEGKFCWNQIVELHFKENEFFMCIDLESPLYDDRKLYYAIIGLCRSFDMVYGEFEYNEDNTSIYL